MANSIISDSGPDFDSFLDRTLSSAMYQALDDAAVDELGAEAGKTQAFATDAITSVRNAVTQLEDGGRNCVLRDDRRDVDALGSGRVQ
jgi:hypothetical protein